MSRPWRGPRPTRYNLVLCSICLSVPEYRIPGLLNESPRAGEQGDNQNPPGTLGNRRYSAAQDAPGDTYYSLRH